MKLVALTVLVVTAAPFVVYVLTRWLRSGPPAVRPIQSHRGGWIVAALFVSFLADVAGLVLGGPWVIASIYPPVQFALMAMVVLPVAGHRWALAGAFFIGAFIEVAQGAGPGHTTILAMVSYTLLVLVYNERRLGQTMREGLLWYFGATLVPVVLMAGAAILPPAYLVTVWMAYQVARVVGSTLVALALWETRGPPPVTVDDGAPRHVVAA